MTEDWKTQALIAIATALIAALTHGQSRDEKQDYLELRRGNRIRLERLECLIERLEAHDGRNCQGE